MRQRFRFSIVDLRYYLIMIIGLAFTPGLSGWIGDVTKDYFNGIPLGPADPDLVLWAFIGLLFIALVIGATGKRLVPVRDLQQIDRVPSRKVVITLLSPCIIERTKSDQDETTWCVGPAPGQDVTALDLKSCIDPDLRVPGFTWQQTLRAAEKHKSHLEKLILIGSKGTKGSGVQLETACEFIGRYFPGKVNISEAHLAYGDSDINLWTADFEKMDSVTAMFRRILRELKKLGYEDSDIIIDVTGGLKTASIAAAMVTLDRPDLLIQYVGTTPELLGQVVGFNAVTGVSGGGI